MIAITGCNGFIGTNLSKHFLNNGESVLGIDNNYFNNSSNVKILENFEKFTFLDWDIIDKLQLPNEVRLVVNLACPASPPIYQKDPLYTISTCYNGVLNMAEAALDVGAVFMHASTSEIYGDPEITPQHENYFGNVNTVGPRSCYDEGKRIAETLIYEMHKTRGLSARIFRIFNTYGPYMDKNDGRVISNFINQSLNLKPLTIYGSGQQTRSFQHISDLVTGIVKFSQLNCDFEILNLGNPEEFTLLELAKIVTTLTENELALDFLPALRDDPKQRRPDILRAKQVLNWEPKVPLIDGLKDTIEYYREN